MLGNIQGTIFLCSLYVHYHTVAFCTISFTHTMNTDLYIHLHGQHAHRKQHGNR